MIILACYGSNLIGYAILERGGTAVEAVEAAVRILEDDPVFDAGTGSVLNEDGDVEMDAMLMDGHTLGIPYFTCTKGNRVGLRGINVGVENYSGPI